jgi:transposase
MIATCPRCGSIGRRLGEKTIDGKETWRCRCGLIWLAPAEDYSAPNIERKGAANGPQRLPEDSYHGMHR